MSLDRAIAQMEAEVAGFKQGTPDQPAEGTADWFLLRAKAIGLSNLRRMKQLEVGSDPAAAERYYRKCTSALKDLEVPPAEVIQQEVIVP